MLSFSSTIYLPNTNLFTCCENGIKLNTKRLHINVYYLISFFRFFVYFIKKKKNNKKEYRLYQYYPSLLIMHKQFIILIFPSKEFQIRKYMNN
jgi:hypothetical protein